MKRILLILTVLISALPGLGAQDKGKKDWHDKWKAEKIAYLTDALDLTSAEAEKFWPVYNKCEREKRNSFKVSMDAYKALDEAIKAGKGDKEINTLLDKYIESRNCGKDIDSKYVLEYRKILPGKKVAKLYIAEESFRRQQIHKLNKDNKNEKR